MTPLYTVIDQNGRDHCALEKALLDAGNNFLLLATVQRSVFIGTDISSLQFNWDNTDGVTLTRYNGTGGPVFFDEGNIKTAFLTDFRPDGLTNCANWIIDALSTIGINATHTQDSNDIMLGDKKICGISNVDEHTVSGTKSYLAFFFSLNIDFTIAANVMTLTKHTTDLQERAIGINQATTLQITYEQVFQALANSYTSYWGDSLTPSSLSQAILDAKASELSQFNDMNWLLYGQLSQ
jgi:lipoate-protein ligase A